MILVGERLASVPGALTAAADLASATGARLAWIPRRAGERGALEAGALPQEGGRDTAGILAAAAAGEIGGLVVGGVDIDDIGHPDGVEALRRSFVVSLEIRPSSVTEHADVILPVAPHAEAEGTFLDWEGRERPFAAALDTTAVGDHRVLSMLADEMGVFLGTRSVAEVRAELAARPARAAATPSSSAKGETVAVPQPGPGQFVLATWRHLLDRGSLQDGEPFLAGTAPTPKALLSPVSAEAIGVVPGDLVTVTADGVRVTAPAQIVEMVDLSLIHISEPTRRS